MQKSLSDLQWANTGGFTPLREALAAPSKGLLNVCIDGPPAAACSGFQVRILN